MKQKKRRKYLERMTGSMATALEMPESALSDVPTTTICSNTEVTVEGCRGILAYTDTEVCLATGRTDIRILGSELRLKCMTDTGTMVTGTILSVEFLSGMGE